MNVRGFRRLPPFPFPDHAWMTDLPCDPCISQRGTHPTHFAELRMFPGPQELGVTGDNRYETLFGRVWAILYCDDDTWHILQWVGSEDLPSAPGITSPGWLQVTDPLLTLPEVGACVERSWTAAFDQSARLAIAYERDGLIEVTRWDASTNQYRQNVSFAGRDPQLLMDATVTDPRAYPNLLDHGWGVREAYFAGVRVLFEWLPEPAWRHTAIPDSDMLLFYLTPDRSGVRARVQQELYGTERVVHDFGEAMSLDQAVALPGAWQLLLGDAVGGKHSDALLSDPYVGGHIINPQASDELSIAAAVEDGRYFHDVIAPRDVNALDVAAAVDAGRYEAMILLRAESESLNVFAAVQAARYEVEVVLRDEAEPLDVTAAVEAALYDQTTIKHEASEPLNVTASVESGRYQEVS